MRHTKCEYREQYHRWILHERISLYGNTMRNIRVRFYDVRTAACHKYRRCKLANCLRLLSFLPRGEHFRAPLMIGFTTSEIYIILKNIKKKESNIHAATSSSFEDKLHFYGAEIERRSNFFIPGEYARIKIFTAFSLSSDYIFSFLSSLRYTLFSARFKSPSITPWCRYI